MDGITFAIEFAISVSIQASRHIISIESRIRDIAILQGECLYKSFITHIDRGRVKSSQSLLLSDKGLDRPNEGVRLRP